RAATVRKPPSMVRNNNATVSGRKRYASKKMLPIPMTADSPPFSAARVRVEAGSKASCAFAYMPYPEISKTKPADISSTPLNAAPAVGISYGVTKLRYFLGSNESNAATRMFMRLDGGVESTSYENDTNSCTDSKIT